MPPYLPFVGIVNIFQTDVFFILEETVELRVVTVEAKFGEQERGVRLDEWSVALAAVSDRTATSFKPAGLSMGFFESLEISGSILQ